MTISNQAFYDACNKLDSDKIIDMLRQHRNGAPESTLAINENWSETEHLITPFCFTLEKLLASPLPKDRSNSLINAFSEADAWIPESKREEIALAVADCESITPVIKNLILKRIMADEEIAEKYHRVQNIVTPETVQATICRTFGYPFTTEHFDLMKEGLAGISLQTALENTIADHMAVDEATPRKGLKFIPFAAEIIKELDKVIANLTKNGSELATDQAVLLTDFRKYLITHLLTTFREQQYSGLVLAWLEYLKTHKVIQKYMNDNQLASHWLIAFKDSKYDEAQNPFNPFYIFEKPLSYFPVRLFMPNDVIDVFERHMKRANYDNILQTASLYARELSSEITSKLGPQIGALAAAAGEKRRTRLYGTGDMLFISPAEKRSEESASATPTPTVPGTP